MRPYGVSSFDPKHPERGYEPAIPLPFYGRSKWWRVWEHFGCHCGQYFNLEEEYRVHYALTHMAPIDVGGN